MQTEQYKWSEQRGWDPGNPPGSLGGRAQAVLLFASPSAIREPGLYDAVRRAYPNASVIGCSTSGPIQGTEVAHDAAVITAIALEHSRARVASARIGSGAGGYDTGRRLAGSLDPAGLRYVFLVCEGLGANANDIVDGLNSALPPGVTMFGGCACDSHESRQTYVVCDAPAEPDTVAVLALYGDRLKIGFGSSGGWDAFGLDRVITRSRKNVVYEFDGRPALPLYKQHLGPAAGGLPASAMLYPLGVATRDSRRIVMRGVLAVDEAAQSITFAGNVPEGTRARFMFGSKEHLIDGSIVSAEESRNSLGDTRPQLIVVVSCVARQLVLGRRVAEELACLVETFGDPPAVSGFYALGEVAPVGQGTQSQFHNETMAVAGVAEI